VDDETRKYGSYEGNIESLNYNVKTASDGSEAVAIIEGSQGDRLIILDMIMPGMGGGETFDRLKADQSRRGASALSSGYSLEVRPRTS